MRVSVVVAFSSSVSVALGVMDTVGVRFIVMADTTPVYSSESDVELEAGASKGVTYAMMVP